MECVVLMNEIRKITFPNGAKIDVYDDDLQKTYDLIITDFVKPYYQETNDWNQTLQISISQLEIISQIIKKSKGSVIDSFLQRIEERLDTDFEDLKGTDKIEILFEALDDYVENISKIIQSKDTKENTRLKIAKLVENLNLFEISELLLFYAKKNYEISEDCN